MLNSVPHPDPRGAFQSFARTAVILTAFRTASGRVFGGTPVMARDQRRISRARLATPGRDYFAGVVAAHLGADPLSMTLGLAQNVELHANPRGSLTAFRPKVQCRHKPDGGIDHDRRSSAPLGESSMGHYGTSVLPARNRRRWSKRPNWMRCWPATRRAPGWPLRSRSGQDFWKFSTTRRRSSAAGCRGRPSSRSPGSSTCRSRTSMASPNSTRCSTPSRSAGR